MGWFNDLYQAYENNIEEVGIVKKTRSGAKYALLPINHKAQTAHIEVTIDQDGDFLKAHMIEKEDAVTIIPCTESSSFRTSGISPHLLHDQLCYVAGDCSNYTNDKRSKQKYQLYINNLRDWCESDFCHEDVRLIYEYLKKEKLISDLVKSSLFHLDEEGKLQNKQSQKKEESVNGNCLVRFNIFRSNEVRIPLWENREIHSLVTSYLQSKFENKGLCYITGKYRPIARKHPKYIRWPSDNAKLISANDDKGFYVHKGRLDNESDIINVGYEVSEKAHHALKWLIQKQGRNMKGQVLLVWGSTKNNIKVPYPNDSVVDFFKSTGAISVNDERKSDNRENTYEIYANDIYNAIRGYKSQLNHKGKVNILMLNSTPGDGRLAVTYYQNLEHHDYIERIKDWHDTCYWKHHDRVNGKNYSFYGAPSMTDIVVAVYGKRAISDKKKTQLFNKTISRLIPCVTERQKLPWDLVAASYQRIIKPAGEALAEWEKNLSTTCALVRKFYEKEGYQVAVDYNNTERDYLFGRLLAVADVLEKKAKGYRYIKNTPENGKDSSVHERKKLSNAMIYMQSYSRYPARTWNTLYQKMIPYLRMFDGKGRQYEKLIHEITTQFKIEDFNDQPLKPTYLIGFASQQIELLEKKESGANDQEEGISYENN